MNRIYWDRDKISIITDQIGAVPHKHWAMQLFLSAEKNLEINVEGKNSPCRCIVVNRNTLHSFSTGASLDFTMIIEPTSSLAKQLDKKPIVAFIQGTDGNAFKRLYSVSSNAKSLFSITKW